jgi:hypothetical protein
MGKLSAALGLEDMAPASDPMAGGLEDPEMLEEPKASDASAEVLAMKMFERASTPEAKVQAMKDFLEACGLY